MASLKDGNLTFRGGQNDGITPNQIGQDQYRRGVNLTTRDGRLGPRPGFSSRDFTIVTEGGVGKQTYSQIYKVGKFQGGRSYDAEEGTFLVAVFSGIIFRLDPKTLLGEVIPIGDEGDRMDQYRRRIPISHAGRFMVFFDHPNLPVILDNRTARRSDPERESFPGVPLPEIPTSAIGTYVQGRLWIANEQNDFLPSDPVGPKFPDAPITFEETFGIAAPYIGQSFSLGTQSARQPITYMGFLQVPDSATGVGPLLVGTKNSVYLFQADQPRINWESIAFGRLSLFNAGPAGPRCAINTNTDIMMKCGDGQIRSLFLGQQAQGRWSNAPMSREVSRWLAEHDQMKLREISFAAYSGNRVFFSVAPYATTAYDTNNNPVFDYAHAGMVVLELDNVSGLGKEASPVWAGLWNGISPMEMVTLEDGAYIFAKDDVGVNRIYFMDESLTYDEFEGEPKNIICRVNTRNYNFQDPLTDKTIGHIACALTNIEGDLDFVSEYRPGHSKNFSLWKHFQHCAPTQSENGPKGVEQEMPLVSPHSFRDLDFGDPEEENCDALTEDSQILLREIELRITLSARNWNLENIHLAFDAVPENQGPTIRDCGKLTNKIVVEEYEPSDWELYRTAPKDPEWP